MSKPAEQRRAEIRERLSKATPGPWEYDLDCEYVFKRNGDAPTTPIFSTSEDSAPTLEDTDFIAHSRTDMEWLDEQLQAAEREAREKAERERDEARKCLTLVVEHHSYRDSLGVPGSSFDVCRFCGAEFASWRPSKHSDNCIMADGKLLAMAQERWDSDDSLASLLEQSEAKLKTAIEALEKCRIAHEAQPQPGWDKWRDADEALAALKEGEK